MKRLHLFLVLALVFLVPLAAHGEENKAVTVTAEGFSYMGDDDTIKEARAKALAEAERNALEEGTSVYIDSSTEVKNFQLTRDEIRKRVRGELRNRKILKALLNRAELKYCVQIQAEVVMVPIPEEELAQKKEEEPEERLPEIAAKDVPEEDEVAEAGPEKKRVAYKRDRPEKPPARDERPEKAPSKDKVELYRRHLLVLKHKKPHTYVQALLTFEPRLNNSQRFAALIRDKTRQRKFLEHRVKNALKQVLPRTKKVRPRTEKVRPRTKKVRPTTRSTDPLADGLKEARRSDPKAFIRVVEMVLPNMKPAKLAQKLAELKEKRPRVYLELVRIIRKAG